MSQVPERREKQQKKKAVPKCKHCKHPLKGHKNVIDCRRNRKEINFIIFLLVLSWRQFTWTTVFLGFLRVIVYKLLLIGQNMTLCHKPYVRNFNKM